MALKLLLATESSVAEFDWLQKILDDFEGEIDETRKQIEVGRARRTRLATLTSEWRLQTYLLRREFLTRALEIARG